MSPTYLASSFQSILFTFRPCFTAPSFEHFAALVCGWILCPGRHTISRAIVAARAVGLGRVHHSTLYRFLSRCRWAVDEVGHVLFQLLLPFLPPQINAAVDDTLCHRTGPQLFGAGMHHDGAQGTYGGQGGRRVSFSFGHSWVILSVWLPLPWTHRGLAVPVLFRLYRPKKRCPKALYRKRTELAREMVQVLSGWLPEGRDLLLSGDQEYGCQTLLQDLPANAEFTGALPRDAALHAPVPRRWSGRGRPPVRGARLPTPAQMFQASRGAWKRRNVILYGKKVALLVWTFEATWFRVRGARPVRVVLTRDPSGRYQDRAVFSTNPRRTPEEILENVVRRWPLETTFQTAKGVLGVEEPRNGWWRRRHGDRRPRGRAGPEPHAERGRLAAERTVPLLLVAYGLVVIWYLRHGKPQRDVARVRKVMPWYTLKTQPSYMDMIGALRREVWAERVSRDPAFKHVGRKTADLAALLGAAA